MIATRILAVLAAFCFVAAFALATLLPPMTTLAQAVTRDEVGVLQALHDFIVAHASVWVWDNLTVPVLTRPSWLLPVCLGVIFAGTATTLASRTGVPRSHRRRS